MVSRRRWWAPGCSGTAASPPRPAAEKPAVTSEDLAEEAGLEPRRLVVDFRDDISEEALRATGFQEVPFSDYSKVDGLYRIDFADADAAAAARAQLARDPDVESVDYDALATIPADEELQEVSAEAASTGSMEAECGAKGTGDGTAFPNDTCFKYQWHLRQIGMEAAWKQGNGKGAVVAVIDTGVTKVGDLADTKFVPGYNFIANNANAADDHGHGTHVAGTIAESTNNRLGVAGIAYGASIMPLKVLSAQGSGSMGGISQAIRWAADHGANVINMSLGGGRAMAPLARAVKYAHDKGVVVVAAAGNDGRGQVELPGTLPGRHRRRGDPAGRRHDLLFELGPGDRYRGAGRQHPSAQQQGRRPAAHDRAGGHRPHRLPLVHGDVDGVAARRGRGRAGRRGRRSEARRGRGHLALHGPQAAGAQRGHGRADRRPLRRRHRRRGGGAAQDARRARRRGAGPGPGDRSAGPGAARAGAGSRWPSSALARWRPWWSAPLGST